MFHTVGEHSAERYRERTMTQFLAIPDHISEKCQIYLRSQRGINISAGGGISSLVKTGDVTNADRSDC